jgi:lipoprotein LprG
MSLKRTAKSLLIVASLALVTGALGACHKDATTTTAATGSLPAAKDLLTQAQTAMGNVQTVHFTVGIDGTLGSVPLQKADGVLTKAGDAKGTATVSELGATIEADFVLVDNSFYLKALTGGYQKMDASAATKVYDPSAILDPNRGIPKLLGTAQNAKTVAQTTVNGKTAYQVSLTPDPTTLDTLVPGASAGTTGSVWIDKDTHRVDKGVFTIPSKAGKTATATITLDDYDAPVTISAP